MLLKQPQLKAWEPYVFFEKEFTPSECAAIIHMAKHLQPNPGYVGAGTTPVENKTVRSSEVRWLVQTEQSQWVFDKLAAICDRVRQNWYPFSLSGFAEPIQITQYLASEGGHYDTHRDFGGDAMSNRKLSIVMLLNPETEFEGGNLEVLAIPGEDKTVKQIAQGSVIAFPSWELHRVTQVTKGERWSLVCWISGPPFT